MTARFPLARLALLALTLAACASAGTREAGVGEFTAEWTGSDTGGLTTRPTFAWCQQAGRLDVSARREDVGIALALYLADLPGGETAGRPRKTEAYLPAFDPGIDTVGPSGAAIASRWFSQKTVTAYQSDSGGVTIKGDGTTISARFGARLRSLNGEDTVRMTGHFSGPAGGACSGDSATSPARVRRNAPPTLVE